MRQAVPSSGRPTAQGISIPAPIRGWNTRDSVAAMQPTDAIFLDNFFPGTTDVSIRKGSAQFATIPDDVEPGSPNNIRSLLSYSSPAAVKKLFAGANTGIFDVTPGGAIAAPSSACTNGEWQSVNLSTPGGAFLWCANGVDKARYFNGAAWTVLDGTSTPALTGVTSTAVVNVSLFKTRLMLTVKDSLSFWYLPVNSVAGAASEFPLGSVFKRGGYIVATETWTLDGGDGADDLFVAITSEGEMVVYRGTDPSNAATWALQGLYHIGKPLSRRCFVKLGGDLAVLTDRGLLPLSQALLSAAINRQIAISDRISGAMTAFAQDFGTLYGWQVLLFPEASMLLVNVPILSNHPLSAVYSYQFVMNTVTRAWCRFTNLFAEAWAVHDGKLFFAVHNRVTQAWTGLTDSGAAIDAKAKTAFMYPAGKASLSRITMLRPIVDTSTGVQLQLGIDTDYRDSSFTTSKISYSQVTALWDTAVWDQSYWSTGNSVSAKWQSVTHLVGRAIALRLRVQSKGVNLSWNATDFILQRGGLL